VTMSDVTPEIALTDPAYYSSSFSFRRLVLADPAFGLVELAARD